MSKIVKVSFEGELMQFNSDGWFNATAAAKKFGKRLDHWFSNAETKTYIEKLTTRNSGELVKTKEGRNGGTWLHPKLAVVFARWLSVDFAIWCDEQIDGIIYGTPEKTDWKKVRHEAAATYKVMSAMLDMKRKLDGKETKKFHYANEAKLVNWAITGEFKPIDRDALPEDDLYLLAKLEEMNALLIGQDVGREDRKVKPLSIANEKRKLLA